MTTANGTAPLRLLDQYGKPMEDDQGFLLKPHRTFSSIWNTVSRTFPYRFDEALRDSPENALAMPRDAFLMGCLFERMFQLAELPWHLEPENEKDEGQKDIARKLQNIIKSTHRWIQFCTQIAWATWYGRYANQIDWRVQKVNGEKRLCAVNHVPVNGDKIQFGWDGCPRVYVSYMWLNEYAPYGSPMTKGIDEYKGGSNDYFVNYPEKGALLNADPAQPIILGDRAPMLVLRDPLWRQRFVIHKHMCIDADYFDGEMAGGIHGVGLRSMIYWFFHLRDEMIGWAINHLKKIGVGGILVFYYEDGNEPARAAAEKAAQDAGERYAIAMPRPRGQSQQTSSAELLPFNEAGVTSLTNVVQDYYERHIERLMIGQSLTSKAEATGLGSSVASLHADTKYRILKFDADNLADTLTEDFVAVAQRWNFPKADFRIRFVFDVPDPNADGKVQLATALFETGMPLKAQNLRAISGFEKPDKDDEIVSQAQLAAATAKIEADAQAQQMQIQQQAQAQQLQQQQGAEQQQAQAQVQAEQVKQKHEMAMKQQEHEQNLAMKAEEHKQQLELERQKQEMQMAMEEKKRAWQEQQTMKDQEHQVALAKMKGQPQPAAGEEAPPEVTAPTDMGEPGQLGEGAQVEQKSQEMDALLSQLLGEGVPPEDLQSELESMAGGGQEQGQEEDDGIPQLPENQQMLYMGSLPYESKHAPKGGITIAGTEFVGGQFIPAGTLAKATRAERQHLEERHAQDAAGVSPQPASQPQMPQEQAPQTADPSMAPGNEMPQETGIEQAQPEQPTSVIPPQQVEDLVAFAKGRIIQGKEQYWPHIEEAIRRYSQLDARDGVPGNFAHHASSAYQKSSKAAALGQVNQDTFNATAARIIEKYRHQQGKMIGKKTEIPPVSKATQDFTKYLGKKVTKHGSKHLASGLKTLTSPRLGTTTDDLRNAPDAAAVRKIKIKRAFEDLAIDLAKDAAFKVIRHGLMSIPKLVGKAAGRPLASQSDALPVLYALDKDTPLPDPREWDQERQALAKILKDQKTAFDDDDLDEMIVLLEELFTGTEPVARPVAAKGKA